MRQRTILVSLVLSLAALSGRSLAQDMADVEIRSEKVADGVYVLMGQGGNMCLCSGEDGTFLIDDEYAPLTAKIQAKVAEITGSDAVRFLLNTHFHGDHTGGNENLGKTGSVIVAQENVRKRLDSVQINRIFDDTTAAHPHAALPVITFPEEITFHVNGDDIHVFHVEHAHTDGDAVVHFTGADVIEAGDVYFNSVYPFIDTEAGGSVEGTIDAADRILDLAGENTRIIPGHGEVSGKAALKAYRDMLVAVRDKIQPMVKEGKSLKDVQAAKPTADLDAEWGDGWLNGETFTRLMFLALGGKEQAGDK